MTRVRTDNVFGTLTDNPLTSGATTMNSAGLANLAVVSSAEALITLDPNRTAGAPEIVVVTAHTGSATSATIQRGQFGTTARQHASGTEWVHGPIASNASSYATAADDQGDFVPIDGWLAFTAVVTQVGSVTVTTNYSKYIRIGRTIMYNFDLSVTGSGTAGTGFVVTMPIAASSTQAIKGGGEVFDTSTGTNYAGILTGASTTTVSFLTDATGTQSWGATPNLGLASGDVIRGFVQYEAAT